MLAALVPQPAPPPSPPTPGRPQIRVRPEVRTFRPVESRVFLVEPEARKFAA